MKPGNGDPSASLSMLWWTAQSSIVAKILPVLIYETCLIGTRQVDEMPPNQSNGLLQSEAVVNIAIHLRENFTLSVRKTPTDLPRALTWISLPILSE